MIRRAHRSGWAAGALVGGLMLSAVPAQAASPNWGDTTSRASLTNSSRQANALSADAALSSTGRYVAFMSTATNLVPGDTNGVADVFVRDRLAGTTRRVSVGPGGRQADQGGSDPSISADGLVVAFSSYSTNLVEGDTNETSDVFVRNLRTGVTRRVSVGPGGAQANNESADPAISAHGRYVVFSSFGSNLVAGTPTTPTTCSCGTARHN